MMPASERLPCALAIHPTSGGFGWAAFRGPLAPYDWGLAHAKRKKNPTCLRRIEELIERFRPDTLVLEAFEKASSARASRITKLCRGIVALAKDRGVDVAVYTRSDIQGRFASVGAKSRDEIAEAVVRHVDALREWLPKKRKAWESEHRRIAVFSAVAAALTHYQLETSQLLNDLSQAA